MRNIDYLYKQVHRQHRISRRSERQQKTQPAILIGMEYGYELLEYVVHNRQQVFSRPCAIRTPRTNGAYDLFGHIWLRSAVVTVPASGHNGPTFRRDVCCQRRLEAYATYLHTAAFSNSSSFLWKGSLIVDRTQSLPSSSNMRSRNQMGRKGTSMCVR